ncbi:MAG: hypothetical protein RH917_20410 [Lacipirellulaceae bacterium]
MSNPWRGQWGDWVKCAVFVGASHRSLTPGWRLMAGADGEGELPSLLEKSEGVFRLETFQLAKSSGWCHINNRSGCNYPNWCRTNGNMSGAELPQ